MNYVREQIQTGQMDSKTWYSVYQLSEELGISRSPVRDGLLRLEEAGAIEFVRNRGFRVVEPKAEDVADIFSLRLALEPAAAARAAKAADPELTQSMSTILEHMETARAAEDEPAFFAWDEALHDTILAAGHARRGREIVKKLRTHTRLLSDSTVRRYRSLEQVHSEHLPIVEAINAANPDAAAAAMREHLTATGLLLLRQAISRTNPELSDAALTHRVTTTWEQFTG